MFNGVETVVVEVALDEECHSRHPHRHENDGEGDSCLNSHFPENEGLKKKMDGVRLA